MAVFGEKIQALMDEAYNEWRKEENKGKGKWDVLNGFSEAHQIAVVFGNFNYQVENGGLEQWIYNGYFHDDAEKFIDYLEIGARLDARCQTILDNIYKLDRYAQETECDRYGSFHDEDGESGFIGDMANCDAFDTWYYAHCGNDDWWETVSGIIDKTEGRDVALSHDASKPEDAPPQPDNLETASTHHPFRVYVENVRDERLGGFTMPLPATAEELCSFLKGIDIEDGRDIKVWEVNSDTKGLGDAIEDAANKSATPDTLNELNYLAAKIDAMRPEELEAFVAALEAKRHCDSVADIINLTDNLSRIDIQPAYDAKQYGAFHMNLARDEYADIMNKLETSADPAEQDFFLHVAGIEMHVDLAAYGRWIAENENGAFTSRGYLTESGVFQETYHGPKDIPTEYRVLPPLAQEKIGDMAREAVAHTEKTSVLERIAAARADRAAQPEKPTPEKPHKPRGPEL